MGFTLENKQVEAECHHKNNAEEYPEPCRLCDDNFILYLLCSICVYYSKVFTKWQ
jgi:hypothetical protein